MTNNFESLVSVIIPTKNSSKFLYETLESIRSQTYQPIEIFIIDGFSTDGAELICKDFDVNFIHFDPGVESSKFDAPYRRNYGAKISNGKYIYFVDADMILEHGLIEECVSLVLTGAGGVIVEERSFGEGIWAKAKSLERRCYVGDDTLEAPRFFLRASLSLVGGLDESLGGGGDDWDLYEKMKDYKISVKRVNSFVLHNEGNLKIWNLIRKRFMYGRDSILYIRKRPKAAIRSYFPIRPAFIRHWKYFIRQPITGITVILMRVLEYSAGALGIFYSFFGRLISSRKSG